MTTAPRPPAPPSGMHKSMAAKATDISSEDIIDKLCTSLAREGDFPTSAKIVSELRNLAMDPRTTANQITEVILREPSLGIRILHIVNSSFYRRTTPIMTVSQAVLRIGMKQLAELCAGLVLLQKFIPAARKDGAFANCLRKAVITPLLTTSLALEIPPNQIPSSKNQQNEGGFLSGLFGELGVLLLAFYYPEIYDSAIKRAAQKNQPLNQSLKELVGMSPYQISERVLSALELPEYYKKVLSQVETPQAMNEIAAPPAQQKLIFFTSQAVGAACDISSIICEGGDKTRIDQYIRRLTETVKVEPKALELAIGRLPQMFREHCDSLELDVPDVPEFLSQYNDASPSEVGEEQTEGALKSEEVFAKYVDEIRAAVENREPTASIITTVMETLAWGLHFDRVLLMLVDGSKKTLRGRMLLGAADFDPKTIVRTVGTDLAPCEVRAFTGGRCIFHGEPIVPNAWPFVAIPIGFGERCVGVIYTDKSSPRAPELTSREQAAVGILAELLDKSISGNVR